MIGGDEQRGPCAMSGKERELLVDLGDARVRVANGVQVSRIVVLVREFVGFTETQEHELGWMVLEECERSGLGVGAKAGAAGQRLCNNAMLARHAADIRPRREYRHVGRAAARVPKVVQQSSRTSASALVVTAARGATAAQELRVARQRYEVGARSAD